MKKRVKNISRFSGLSYQDLLDQESRPVPQSLRESTETYLGSEPLSVDRYLSREYHEQEKRQLWPKVWQSLCRETEISSAGDFYVHDVSGWVMPGAA